MINLGVVKLVCDKCGSDVFQYPIKEERETGTFDFYIGVGCSQTLCQSYKEARVDFNKYAKEFYFETFKWRSL